MLSPVITDETLKIGPRCLIYYSMHLGYLLVENSIHLGTPGRVFTLNTWVKVELTLTLTLTPSVTSLIISCFLLPKPMIHIFSVF